MADDRNNDYLEKASLVEVRPLLNMISSRDLECMPPEGGRSLPSRFPLRQPYVHTGKGRQLPSKTARKDPRHGKNVPVTIEEPTVSPKIARPEPASTIFSLGMRLSSWETPRRGGTDRPEKGEIVKDRSSAIGIVYKASSGSRTFPVGGRVAATASIVAETAPRAY